MAIERQTVLVVDDEPAIQRLLVAILARQGYTVLEARHAVHALQLCEHYPGPIHLLLTDVVMPYMNGRELASHALALRPQMRVLYISGYEAGILMQGLDSEEEVAFLQKPFSSGVLLQKVRDVLGQWTNTRSAGTANEEPCRDNERRGTLSNQEEGNV